MIVPIEPVPKPRMTRRDRWAKRPAVVKYYDFCDRLRELYTDEIPEKLLLCFMVSMPKSWSQKKKDKMEGRPHQQRPDIDNLIKAVLDAKCEDDSYVHTVIASKIWSVEGTIVVDSIAGINPK